jgi:predicted tellurium resistance membrane protein TerC
MLSDKIIIVFLSCFIFLNNIFIFLITYKFNSLTILFVRKYYAIFSIILEILLFIILIKSYINKQKRKKKKK